ncbi:hypothetical protein NC653_035453 [Populus alba x Populus x berolinensis]|uniref:Uncharacterized protein n=1 Tax=Populus alba x Populus x berolinensis TaxID=444605 RepID=A0AAD6LQJ9_9ROSI|nr:hypothetical protein NC653_035453 [Populus alba x Populus x berolinensis]
MAFSPRVKSPAQTNISKAAGEGEEENKAAWLLGVKTLENSALPSSSSRQESPRTMRHSFSENSPTFPGSSLKVRSNEAMAPGCRMDDSPDETLKDGNKYVQDSLDLTRELLLHHNLKGR